ncbi:MAG: hydrogenase maturation nickel metallochaperone HypA [Thermaerobacter sp.]|jgi:hydrogenase nickel incorporation protein HypA/HybF|nr:hydrogenase maturation nickel metallochaperone HypA [Thermaerobacter sp.]
MHEASLAQAVLERIEEAATTQGAVRVVRIVLEVGELSGVVPEALELALRCLAPGTPAQGAEIVLVRSPARARCAACGERFHPSWLPCACPRCASPAAVLEAGQELLIREVEGE